MWVDSFSEISGWLLKGRKTVEVLSKSTIAIFVLSVFTLLVLAACSSSDDGKAAAAPTAAPAAQPTAAPAAQPKVNASHVSGDMWPERQI